MIIVAASLGQWCFEPGKVGDGVWGWLGDLIGGAI
jgi:hypothetical protein